MECLRWQKTTNNVRKILQHSTHVLDYYIFGLGLLHWGTMNWKQLLRLYQQWNEVVYKCMEFGRCGFSFGGIYCPLPWGALCATCFSILSYLLMLYCILGNFHIALFLPISQILLSRKIKFCESIAMQHLLCCPHESFAKFFCEFIEIVIFTKI